MEQLSVKSFFSLDRFAHSDLFANCQFAWEPLGHIEEYLSLQRLGLHEVKVPIGVYLINPEQVSIGAGTRIEPGAYIEGPCIIGKDCVIRHGAYIRGHLITGDRCVIGHTTEIKQSILLNDVQAAHFNYVGNSILGNDVNLGAGVKCANFRLDHKPVVIHFDGHRIETSLVKLGALIGDGAQLGCNGVTNPGTLIEKGAFCYPCTAIHGYISSQNQHKRA